MDAMARAKMWIGGLTDIGLMLLALAIVAALLVGRDPMGVRIATGALPE